MKLKKWSPAICSLMVVFKNEIVTQAFATPYTKH